MGGTPDALSTGAVAGVDAGAVAARPGLLCAEDAFWRAMLASLSRILLGTAWFVGGAAGLLPDPRGVKRLGGGLPGGVVDWSVDRGVVRANVFGVFRHVPGTSGEDIIRVNLLAGFGAFSFSLNELTIEGGNV